MQRGSRKTQASACLTAANGEHHGAEPLMTSVLQSGKFTRSLSHTTIIITSALPYPLCYGSFTAIVRLRHLDQSHVLSTTSLPTSRWTHLPPMHPSHRLSICPGPRPWLSQSMSTDVLPEGSPFPHTLSKGAKFQEPHYAERPPMSGGFTQRTPIH